MIKFRFFAPLMIIFVSMFSGQNTANAKTFDGDILKDIAYAGNGSADKQKLDLYLPTLASKKQVKSPVLIYVHGGAWTKGDKKRLKLAQVEKYRSKGIIVATLNYRLGPQNKYPDNVNDIITSTRWLSQNIGRYGGDPNNMVLVGHSAGAHLVAMAEVKYKNGRPNRAVRDRYKAVFAIDTASFDLTKPSVGRLSRWTNRQKYSVFGKSRSDLAAASPTLQVSRGKNYVPFHIYTTETRQDAVNSGKAFAAVLKKSGNIVTSTIVKGGLSHSDMNEAIFDPQSQIYKAIYGSLK